jgi:peptide deformylase
VKGSGVLARVLQHEIDHLEGILFVDRIEDRSTLRYIPDEEEETAEAATGT